MYSNNSSCVSRKGLNEMFQVEDYIIYGNAGVCQVKNVGVLDSLGASKDRMYYTLSPRYAKESKIFTPVDNKKVIMRPVLTKGEAIKLIDSIKEVGCLYISDEKKREQEYKEAFQKCDCMELVKVIKTIYLRKQSRIAEGKKGTSGDEKYFQMAEENLYGELAISLDMGKEEVKEFVIERVEQFL